MKILLINYAYFITGGPERYMFNVKSLLEKHEHEVILFSMEANENENSKYSRFFAKSINSDGSWYFAGSRDIKSKFRQLGRLFYSFHVKKQLTNLIQETKPDIAYVLHYHKKLSPSIISACKENSVPVVVRVSDYLMMCPEAHFYRDGKICEKCKQGTWNSVKYKCIKNSSIASFIWWVANKVHWYIGSYEKIDRLVCTNNFMRNKIEEYYPKKFNMTVIPTFVPSNNLSIQHSKYSSDIISYIGHITETKGILILFKAISLFKQYYPDKKVKIIIIGRDKIGIDDYLNKSKSHENCIITYIPHSDRNRVDEILNQSKYLVFPSNIYENLPNIVLESFNTATPVIARAIGSLKELIINDHNGFTYTNQNPIELMHLIHKAISVSKREYNNLQLGCKETINNNYNEYNHYNSLMDTFNEVINN